MQNIEEQIIGIVKIKQEMFGCAKRIEKTSCAKLCSPLIKKEENSYYTLDMQRTII